MICEVKIPNGAGNLLTGIRPLNNNLLTLVIIMKFCRFTVLIKQRFHWRIAQFRISESIFIWKIIGKLKCLTKICFKSSN